MRSSIRLPTKVRDPSCSVRQQVHKNLVADSAGLVRKLVPRGYFESRMEKISGEVKKSCFETLEKDKSEEVSRRMISEISTQIEECLMRMAEVVEIPLGK